MKNPNKQGKSLILQLVVIKSVRKELPPAVRVFKDNRRKRKNKIDVGEFEG